MKKTFLILALSTLGFLGCGKEEGKVSTAKKEITLSIWEGTGEEYFMELNNLSEAYKKINPNVTLKIEKIPGSDYDTAMKIRNTAQQLPDIFAVRNKHMYTYRDSVIDLNGLEAAKLNIFAEAYKIDNKVIGLPMYGFNEFVYYRKSIFKDLGLSEPETWGQFLEIIDILKNKGGYVPLAIGGKDLWTTYPYGQFIPYLVKNGDNVLNKMGEMKNPFVEGTPVYEGYKKVSQLFDLKPAGDNPIGYGWSQETNMFLSKKAAMMAAGQWYYKDYMKDAPEEDKGDLGMFLMPVRDNLDEKFRYFVTGEVFLAIPTTSKNQEEAKEFLNWFFGSDYYKAYINHMQVLPAVADVKLENSPFADVLEKVQNKEAVYQIPGYEKYTKIKNATHYDQNQLSQDLLSGVNFQELMAEWGKKWEEAWNNLIGG